jgi:alkanesulfonate monooxygenase
MSRTALAIGWFLPTKADGRHLTSGGLPRVGTFGAGERPASLEYLGQIARAADRCGFDHLMIASGFKDPWLIAAAMAGETRRLKFLLATRPGVEQPAFTVQKAATLQCLSDGRLQLHIVGGSSSVEQRSLGDFLGPDERYARSAEFIQALRSLWPNDGRPHHGRFYQNQPALSGGPRQPIPPFYLGGASALAEQIAAAQGDVYLMWGEPPEMIAERIERMRELAGHHRRTLLFGLRLHVFAEPTSEQAWRRVGQLVEEIPADAICSARRQLEAYESVGQQRQISLREGRTRANRDLEISANLWAGVGLVRGGAGTALVGSYAEIAERIEKYRALGVDSFTLSGYPHLEEALHVGEQLLPLLRRP